MSVIRWVLIVWSALSVAASIVFAVLTAQYLVGPSAMRVFALLLWAGLHGLNAFYLLRCSKSSGAKI
jgi:hypothetical protein